jgi:hypothetical protein
MPDRAFSSDVSSTIPDKYGAMRKQALIPDFSGTWTHPYPQPYGTPPAKATEKSAIFFRDSGRTSLSQTDRFARYASHPTTSRGGMSRDKESIDRRQEIRRAGIITPPDSG